MKKTNGQSGITLIALVVTIVVLLILAGITITFVVSDGGIFSTAQDAKYAQEKAEIRDIMLTVQSTYVTASFTETFDTTNTESARAQAIATASFNGSGYTPTVTSLTAADHKLGGTMTVEAPSGTTYDVTFGTNGVPSVDVQAD